MLPSSLRGEVAAVRAADAGIADGAPEAEQRVQAAEQRAHEAEQRTLAAEQRLCEVERRVKELEAAHADDGLQLERKAQPDSGSGIEFTTPGTGFTTAYLARAKSEVPVVPWTAEDSEPAFSGTIDEFRETMADEKTRARLNNKVKVCAACKKPCAISLASCNACGTSLDGVPTTYNDNVFMGFVHGISKGRFPYKMSLRYQDESYLCFDDPLSLSPLHTNCIPTHCYVPDLRFLFVNPDRGLALINKLFEVGAKVALEQFWSNEQFRNKIFNGETKPQSAADIMETACCGLNFPPSMYQLHLQFIHMPMLPYQYFMARKNGHWHHGRFFPLEYLRKALALGDKVKMEVNENTDIKDIIHKVSENGVVYDSVHREFLHKCWGLQERFSAWAESDFECQVVNEKVYNMADGRMEPGSDPKGIQAEDTKKLQNYGRPYTEEGKTTGTYYKYAKKATEVEEFC